MVDRAEGSGEKVCGSETRVKCVRREEGLWTWIEGRREAVEVAGAWGRKSARRGRKTAERGASLKVFGNWKTWWQTKVRTRSRPRRVGDVFGMWDRRLVRLALLQQLRAVYGIKVKGGRGLCDRRRRETAVTEIRVSGNTQGRGRTSVMLARKDTWLEVSSSTCVVVCLCFSHFSETFQR